MSEEQQASEAEPVSPIEQGTEAPPETRMGDLFEMDMDTLRTKIESAESEVDAPVEEPVEEAQAPIESEAAAEPDAVEEVAAEPEKAQAAEPTNGEAEVTELDMLRAEMELQQAESKRLESLLGQRGGEDGFFKRKAAELEAQIQRLSQGNEQTDTYTDRVEPVQQPQPTAKQAPGSQDLFVSQLAAKEALGNFLSAAPAAIKNDDSGQLAFSPEMEAAMQPHASKIEAAILTGDAQHAKSEVSRLLNSGWATVEFNQKKANVEEMRRKRADQAERLTNKKRASAAASPSSTSAAPAKRQVDPSSLSTEELRKRAFAEDKAMGRG